MNVKYEFLQNYSVYDEVEYKEQESLLKQILMKEHTLMREHILTRERILIKHIYVSQRYSISTPNAKALYIEYF